MTTGSFSRAQDSFHTLMFDSLGNLETAKFSVLMGDKLYFLCEIVSGGTKKCNWKISESFSLIISPTITT